MYLKAKNSLHTTQSKYIFIVFFENSEAKIEYTFKVKNSLNVTQIFSLRYIYRVFTKSKLNLNPPQTFISRQLQ